MDGLPIEIQNKIWNLYYSHIYYINVTSIFNEKIAICNKINNSKESLENCYTFDNLS